jgi:Ca2+-binding RTX toxin-like protein
MASKNTLSARPSLEALEGRSLMAAQITATLTTGGVLYVEGTANADRITVRETSGCLTDTVSVDNALIYNAKAGRYQTSVSAWEVSQVQVNALAGNDVVDLCGPTASAVYIQSMVWGGDGNDWVRGGALRSQLMGGNGDDTLIGGGGNDSIWGEAGSDAMWGEGGADDLMGGAGNDELIGGGGNDRLWGEAGSDWLWGCDGNDYLDGGADLDFAWGGSGADSFANLNDSPNYIACFGFFSPRTGAHTDSSGIQDFSSGAGDFRY